MFSRVDVRMVILGIVSAVLLGIILSTLHQEGKEVEMGIIKDKLGNTISVGDQLHSEDHLEATITVSNIDREYGEDCLVLEWDRPIPYPAFRLTAKSLLNSKWVKQEPPSKP